MFVGYVEPHTTLQYVRYGYWTSEKYSGEEIF